MKLNLLFSFSAHIMLFAFLLIGRPGIREWTGYPTVIPVELVEIKPVSYKMPEVEKIQPRLKQETPTPNKLVGVTLKKKKIERKKPEPIEEPKVEEKLEKADQGKSTVSDENVRLDVKEFPFSYYLALLKSRIQANWEPPANVARRQRTMKTIVSFKVQRQGQITRIATEKSSGNYIFDQAAIRAVTLANPLPPLPFDFPEKELGVHFEFEQGI
ncbi:MAG: TonB family protein [bacterium]